MKTTTTLIAAALFFAPSARGQDCAVIEQFMQLHAEAARTPAGTAFDTAHAAEWLPRLLAIPVDSPCRYEMRGIAVLLAEQMNDWRTVVDVSRESLADEAHLHPQLEYGRQAIAIMHMNVARGLMRIAEANGGVGSRDAIRAGDALVALAARLDSERTPGAPAMWMSDGGLVLSRKASFYRDRADFVAAAAAEMQASAFLSSYHLPRADLELRSGLIPEECIFRAARDYLYAGRVNEATATLMTIDLLENRLRPATHHALNMSLAKVPAEKLLEFTEAVLRTFPLDGYLTNLTVKTTTLARGPLAARACSSLDPLLNGPEAVWTAAIAVRTGIRGDRPLPAGAAPNIHAQALSTRAWHALELNDHQTALGLSNEISHRGWDGPWNENLLKTIQRRATP